jgi:peptidoglycan/xylan/chitin deacetylase (PgdA/CDA1 family)
MRRRSRFEGLRNEAKRLLKASVSPTLDRLGVFDAGIARRTDAAWTIVLYHRIVPQRERGLLSNGMCVTLDRFEAQIAWFRRAFQPIRMDEAMALLARGEPLPPRALSVTFDDGYRDNLDLALPVLERHAMPATLFVPTGGLACGEPFWWDRVAAAFSATAVPAFDPAEVGLPGWRSSQVPLGFGHRQAVLRDVIDALWELPQPQAITAVGALERVLLRDRRFPRTAVRTPPRLTAAEVRTMHRRGVEIGAHSVHHGNFERLCAQEIVAQVEDSRTALEALCDAPVRGFAYPAGRLNPAVVRTVASCSVDYAVTTAPGVNRAGTPPHALMRIGMPDDPVGDFKRAFVGVVRATDPPPDPEPPDAPPRPREAGQTLAPR